MVLDTVILKLTGKRKELRVDPMLLNKKEKGKGR